MWFPVRLLVLALALNACKADKERCELATRNYAALTYWKTADAEIAKQPVDKREALRKRKLAQFTHELENGIDILVSQCQSANNEDMIECMIAAKTGEQALECAPLSTD